MQFDAVSLIVFKQTHTHIKRNAVLREASPCGVAAPKYSERTKKEIADWQTRPRTRPSIYAAR